MTDREAGLAKLDDSRRLFERAGHEWGVAMTMFAMSWTLNATSSEAPLEFFEEAARRARSLGWETETLALGSLARRRALRGEIGDAKQLLAEALQRVLGLDATVGVAVYLDLIADIAATAGDDALATRLSASAEATFQRAGRRLMPLVTQRATRLANLRERLGERAYEVEWQRGTTRHLDEATEEALAWTTT
jgi:hypothetical protein